MRPEIITMAATATFEAYIDTLDPWKIDILSHVTMDVDPFTLCLEAQTNLRAVSDGSTLPTGSASFGWILSTQQGKRLPERDGPSTRHESSLISCQSQRCFNLPPFPDPNRAVHTDARCMERSSSHRQSTFAWYIVQQRPQWTEKHRTSGFRTKPGGAQCHVPRMRHIDWNSKIPTISSKRLLGLDWRPSGHITTFASLLNLTWTLTELQVSITNFPFHTPLLQSFPQTREHTHFLKKEQLHQDVTRIFVCGQSNNL